MSTFKTFIWGRTMAQYIRTLLILPENRVPVPSAHTAAHDHL